MQPGTVLRVARPTDHLAAIAEMYATGLDFIVLTQFEDHDGFDGIIFRHPQQPYHLKFTTQRGHQVGKALHKIIYWSSISPIMRNGKPVVLACSQWDFNMFHPIIPIGKPRGRRLRISMGIASYS